MTVLHCKLSGFVMCHKAPGDLRELPRKAGSPVAGLTTGKCPWLQSGTGLEYDLNWSHVLHWRQAEDRL